MLKILLACLAVFFTIRPFVSATDVPVDFDGKYSKSSNRALQLSGIQRPTAKINVSLRLDDGTIIPIEPAIDKSGTKHYSFVPGRNHARINYTCSGPTGQTYTWYLQVAPTFNFPQDAGHRHSLPNILNSGDCKKHTQRPCTPVPPASVAYLINGTPWQPGGSISGMITSPPLNQNSVFTVYMDDPKYATQLITQVAFNGACTMAETASMDILVPSLQELPLDPSYVLGGNNQLHPFNHYATINTVAAISALGKQWRKTHASANKLVFNDMSLKWGGLFDVFGNWTGSHSNHSFGTALDLSKRCVKKSNRAALIRLMDDLGFTVQSEGNTLDEQNHYHIQYAKEITRLRGIQGFPITADGRMVGISEYADESYESDGGSIGPVTPPPPIKSVSSCGLAIKAYPNPTFNCDTGVDINGVPLAGTANTYCQCINLYVKNMEGEIAVLREPGDSEPANCY